MQNTKWQFKVSSCFILLIACSSLPVATVIAETRIHQDYIAIDIEAESLDQTVRESEDTRWTLTNPITPQTEDDPDGNNSDGAVGSEYIELLPDIRVAHGDPFTPPTAFWGVAGTGPTVSYEVDFPETGRYFVHIRASSSGSEDNGIHVGINDTWPPDGRAMQLCAINQGWVWSSRRRSSGGVGHCGVDHSIWLDVEKAGVNTVMFSAREDGFELDRFMLIKHLNEESRICSASGENDVICEDGFVETADGFTDAEVDLSVNRNVGIEGDTFVFTAEVSNEDGFDHANDLALTIDLDYIDDWELDSVSSECSLVATGIHCELGDETPTFPNNEQIVTFSLRVLSTGEKEITAQVSTSGMDEVAENNSSSVLVVVEQGIEYTLLENTFSIEPVTPFVLDNIAFFITIQNSGDVTSVGTEIVVDFPEELELISAPDGCVSGSVVQCSVDEIVAGDTSQLDFGITTDMEGVYPVAIQLFADNIVEGSLSDIFSVEVYAAEEAVDTSGPETPEENESDPSTEEEGASSELSALQVIPEANSSESGTAESESLTGEDNASEAIVESLQTNGGGAVSGFFYIFLTLWLFFRRLTLLNRVNHLFTDTKRWV